MKPALKSFFLFLIIALVFCSCSTYKIERYKPKELDKLGKDLKTATVYIHDKTSIYKVDNASVTPAGVKGDLTPVLNPVTIGEINNPQTRKQFKTHKNDLIIYTKTEVKDNSNDVKLKKDDITDFTRILKVTKVKPGDVAGSVIILGVCSLLWIGIYDSFQGML